jgi:lysophospholipase L1-like esterase
VVTNAVERPRTASVGQPFARRVATLLLAAVAALPLVLSIPARAGADTPPPTFNPPKQYYLSLGESFAFGLQFDRLVEMLDTGTYTPDAFNTGFTDVFAALMRQIRPDLQVVNYSCPGGGGDTVRFITDGCYFTDIGLDLHNNFVGSQLDAAVRFLRDHPGQVSPVTISTGDDDIFDAVYNCNADPTCLANSGLAQRLSNNLGHILSALRGAAPNAEIIMYLPHNLLEVDVPGSDPAFGPYLDEMRAIAAAHRVRVVDGFAAITASGRSCELTNLCISDDGHPNDAGYELLGHLFFDASGYERLLN